MEYYALENVLKELRSEFTSIEWTRDLEDAIVRQLYIAYKYGKDHGWHHDLEADIRRADDEYVKGIDG